MCLIKIFIAIWFTIASQWNSLQRDFWKKPTLIKRNWIKCVNYAALFANYSGTALVSHDF